ncbi:MAG: hypothetical protein IJR47_04950 [Clostridia bacterium]|nr:hypothetical protein [Clostridia bacterium]
MTSGMTTFILSFVAAAVLVMGSAIAVSSVSKLMKTLKRRARIIKKEERGGKYFLVFSLFEERKTVEYAVSKECYAASPENVYGTLCTKGNKIIYFGGEADGKDFKIEYA